MADLYPTKGGRGLSRRLDSKSAAHVEALSPSPRVKVVFPHRATIKDQDITRLGKGRDIATAGNHLLSGLQREHYASVSGCVGGPEINPRRA